MPEMLQFCGTEQTIYASAHKTYDTIEHLGRSREVPKAVHLSGVRCDGSAHSGCQAQCMIFWREEWPEVGPLKSNKGISMGTLKASTQDGELYKCQATAMRQASKPLPTTRLGQYVTDVRSRNEGPVRLIKGLLIAAFNLYQWNAPRWLRPFGGRTYPFYGGTGNGKRRPSGEIQVGDLVEVRPKAEIMATLARRLAPQAGRTTNICPAPRTGYGNQAKFDPIYHARCFDVIPRKMPIINSGTVIAQTPAFSHGSIAKSRPPA